jgi:hypothetical protein
MASKVSQARWRDLNEACQHTDISIARGVKIYDVSAQFTTKRDVHSRGPVDRLLLPYLGQVKEGVERGQASDGQKPLRQAGRRIASVRRTEEDDQVSAIRRNLSRPVLDRTLVDLLPYFEHVKGERLYPMYCYARPREELLIHIDLEASETGAPQPLGLGACAEWATTAKPT